MSIAWGAIGQGILQREQKEREHKRETMDIERKATLAALPPADVGLGRRRLEALERAEAYFYEHSGIKLGYMQEKMVHEIKIAFLPKMFGDELIVNLNFLCRKFNIETLNTTLGIVFPRRSGKTMGAAIIIALIAVSQPDVHLIMYNLTGRQATEFLAKVIEYMRIFKDSPEFGWDELQLNSQAFIHIHSHRWNTHNSVKSYASALNGNANRYLHTQSNGYAHGGAGSRVLRIFCTLPCST